jgi:hypothetical protein
VDVRRPVVTAANSPAVPTTRSPAVSGDPPRHSLEPDTANANGTVYRPPRLARRKPGAKLPKDLAADSPPAHPGSDEVLLKRIRTALRALR